MYGEIVYDNDEQRIRLAQASGRAAEGWRFRYHKGPAGRLLSAAWAEAKRLLSRTPTANSPAIATARKQLSC